MPTVVSINAGGGGGQEAYLEFVFPAGSLAAQTQDPGFDVRFVEIVAGPQDSFGGDKAGQVGCWAKGNFPANAPAAASMVSLGHNGSGLGGDSSGAAAGTDQIFFRYEEGFNLRQFIATIDKVAGGIRITPTINDMPAGEAVVGVLVRG